MILRGGITLLEFTDLVNNACISKSAYDKAVRTGRVVVVHKGGGGHPALIDWNSLPEKYKDMVRDHMGGEPAELAEALNLEKFLALNDADRVFIDAFKGSNGLRLKDAKRKQLKNAARVLALLSEVHNLGQTAGLEAITERYGMPVRSFKEAILKYIKAEKVQLPKSFARLEARKRAYLDAIDAGEPGARSLIHGHQGNNIAAKVATELQTGVLLKLTSRHQNFSRAATARHYNAIAKVKGWSTITPNTVKNFLKDGEKGRTATLYSRGQAAYQQQYGISISRQRATRPVSMWVTDGKVYELYYQQELIDNKGKRKVAQHKRKVVAVVIDAYCNYPVGYAIGDVENMELNAQAMKNAVDHMHELSGQYVLPYQIQSDKLGAKGALGNLYQAVAKYYTPAAAGNARSKVIEPYFKVHDDLYVQRHRNYAGHNVNSLKKNQPNADALNKLKSHFPDEAGVIEQIHQDFREARMNTAQEFLAGLGAIPAEKLRLADRQNYLELFGITHKPTNGHNGNTLTIEGISPTLLGEQRRYQFYNVEFQNLIGTSFEVTYDPADLTSVLVKCDGGARRFVLNETNVIPMAIQDHTPQTRRELAEMAEFKLALSQAAIDAGMESDRVVRDLVESLNMDLPAARPTLGGGHVHVLSPDQEAITKGYFIEKGSHKTALNNAESEALTSDNAEQWAFDNF